MRTGFLFALLALASVAYGEVHTLTEDNFDEKTKSGLWFLKFYAPWCGHCKHMAPVLEEASTKVAGMMNIGKIDCTVETGLASRFGVQGYPTLKFRKNGGEFEDYSGGRDVAGLTTFASRMHGPAVAHAPGVSAIRDLLSHNEVVFLLAYAPGKSAAAVAAFEKAAGTRQHLLTFASTTSKEVVATFPGASLPFVAKMEANEEPVLFTGNPASAAQLGPWVDEHRFPVVSEVGPATFRDLRDSGRKLAIACVDPETPTVANAAVETMLQLARPASASLSTEVRKQFLFAHINAVVWADFLERYDIRSTDLPAVLIIDGANDRFYTDPSAKSSADIAAFLARVSRGEAEGRVDGTGLFSKMRRLIEDTWPASLIVIALSGLGLAGVLYLLVRACLEEDEDSEAAIEKRIARAEAEAEAEAAANSKTTDQSTSDADQAAASSVRRRRRKAD